MNEQSVASARASVMFYDSTAKKWINSGTSSGLSKVHIYHHTENNTFRVVGRKVQNHEVVINCSILKGLKYFQATPTFHQWRDNNQIHGLNFASKDDAEAFALAMERVLDILGHTSMYLSTHRSPSQSQPLYQTIGHSGVSLDDYAEYRGWMNNENGERKNSDYGQYRSSQVNHSSHPTTPGSIPSPSSYSHHRASSASSTLQQPVSLPAQQPSPQSSVPPPPPPPPPSNLSLSGIATLPRLNIKPAESEPSETSLAAALASAKLKRTPSKASETPTNENKQPPPIMASMLDEMARTLARRRAHTDSSVDVESNCSGDSSRSWNRQNSINGYSPNKNSGGESPQSLRKSDFENDGKNQIVVDVAEMDRMKQDIMSELKKEMNKMKQDIIDAIKMELNRR